MSNAYKTKRRLTKFNRRLVNSSQQLFARIDLKAALKKRMGDEH